MRNKGNRFNDSISSSYIQYMYSTIYVLVREVVAGTEVRTAVLNAQHQWLQTIVINSKEHKTKSIAPPPQKKKKKKKKKKKGG